MVRSRKGLSCVWLAAALLPSTVAPYQSQLPTQLPSKELLQYTIEWRLVTAGKARLRLQAVQGGWEAALHLESSGLVSKLYRVDDRYQARLGDGLCAINSALEASEGRKRRQTNIAFDAGRRKASYRERDLETNSVVLEKEIEVPVCVHEIVGALHRLRTLKLESGRSLEIPISDGKKSVSARVEVQQPETVKTTAGEFKTLRYEAFLFNNVLYRRPGRVYLWLTDDARRLPVQIQVRLQFPIGTITLQLEKTES